MENQKKIQTKYGWEYPYLYGMELALKGNRRETRNGVTLARFVHQMRFDLTKNFPLLTTKKVNFDLIKAELLWFIEGGRKPNKYLNEVYGRLSTHRLDEIYGKPCHIWDGDTENFKKKKKAQFDGDCGRIYGAQWRNWEKHTFIPGHSEMPKGMKFMVPPWPGRAYWVEDYHKIEEIDQLANLIHLLKTDPTSRYMRVTAWNPAELEEMSLGACHLDFQCFVAEGKLSLHMNQRSCDMFLGVPFNIASYALLTHMLAQVCHYQVGELIVTLNDYHVYEKHIAAVKEQLSRSPSKLLPQLRLNPEIHNLDSFRVEDIEIKNYAPQPSIKAELLTSVIKN